MNKLNANVSLLIITFFAAIQYVFLVNVPDSVSHFAFLCITNFIGFIIMLVFFFGELFRLDKKQVLQTFILSAQLFGFNVFMLLGAKGLETTVTACVLSSYFVFIPILSFLFFKQKTEKNAYAAIAIVLVGLFFMMEADIGGLLHIEILYLLISNVFFAMYIMTTGKYSASSNPSILAMGQMLFNFIFALIFWVGESVITKAEISIPTESAFWGSVLYISFFIRGLYGIIQIYAQRYVSPLNTSLIFSSEIIMTMAASPVLTYFFGTEPERITPMRVIGAFIMFVGILVADSAVISVISKRFAGGKSGDNKIFCSIGKAFDAARKGFFVNEIKKVLLSAVLYVFLDISLQVTHFLDYGSYIGIKNFLPATMALFMGTCGVIGGVIGCAAAAVLMSTPPIEVVCECISIVIMGVGIWLMWHIYSDDHRVNFKTGSSYVRYILMLLACSAACGGVTALLLGTGTFLTVLISYMVFNTLVGIPVNIVLGGLLCIENTVPPWYNFKSDLEFGMDNTPESMTSANELIEEYAFNNKIGMKRLFEIQNCIEELSIRIFKSLPDTEIKVVMIFGDTVSARINYEGTRYNPLYVGKGDDIMDIAGLKLIRHHALRASYKYSKSGNHIHVVL